MEEQLIHLGIIESKEELPILYTMSNHIQNFYTSYSIKKRSGGVRKILAPKPILKKYQRRIASHILSSLPVSSYANAYVPSRSILSNVEPHVGKTIVLKLDIEDFFPNITYEKVYAIWPKTFSKSLKTLLTHLVTYYDYLPQGAPTSPVLSNLIMNTFDVYIGAYCEKQHIAYTRYCDDLTFSGDFDVRILKKQVKNFLYAYGFLLNEKKTKILRKFHAQMITGITVNEKINVKKRMRKKIRQEMYYIQKYGLESHAKRMGSNPLLYKQHLMGQIQYCLQIHSSEEMLHYQNILKKNMES